MAPAYIMLTGPLFVGSLLSYFFFGAFFLQLSVYFTTFAQSDKKIFVGLVCFVAVVEVLHLFFTTHTAYAILAEGFGDVNTLVSSPWSGSALPTLNGIVAFATQLFFAWRINRLGKNLFAHVAAVVIVLLGLMQCSAAVAVTVQFINLKLEIKLLKTLRDTVIVWLAGTLACDVVMTVSIIIVLMFYKRSTSYQASKNMIDTFIAHTIENGALTTAGALLNLVFYLVYPDNLLYACVEFILGRLYANVLMATLNRRDRSRITANTEDYQMRTKETASNGQLPLTNLRTLNQNTRPTTVVTKSYPVVSITTEIQVDDDANSSQDQKNEYAL